MSRSSRTLLLLGVAVAIFICEPLRFGAVSFVAGTVFLASMAWALFLDLCVTFPLLSGVLIALVVCLVGFLIWKQLHRQKETV